MSLYYREYGEPDSGSPLVFLHGLFGSSTNWGRIATAFSDTYHCIVPDLRNHGRSFHDDAVDYAAQSSDLVDLLKQLGVEKATFIGHSMGGKVAMFLALNKPGIVDKLVVVDMAPRAYTHSFATILQALEQIDLEKLASRMQADELLAATIPESGVRAYLLQNLVRASDGWRWRINIESLSSGITAILDFPVEADKSFSGAACFIYGKQSSYVDEKGKAAIRHYFPNHQLTGIDGAGHWVYADQPDAFIEVMSGFLGA